MKSIKRILCCLFLLIITVVCSTENVFAKDHDHQWPSYDTSKLAKINNHYCSYNIGQLYDIDSEGFEKTHYANKDIYLSYYDGVIYYIHPGGKKFNFGEFKKGGSAWDKDWANQKIMFYSDELKEYLVENEKVSCKPLHFYEYNDNLFIVTPEAYESYDIADAGKTPARLGSLMYKGVELSNKCSDVSSQVNSVYSMYQTAEKNSIINSLKELSYQGIYQLGDAQKAKQYYDNYMTIYNAAYEKYKDLDLATADNNRKFNVNQCDVIDSSISKKYEELMSAFKSDLAKVEVYFNNIIQLNKRTEQQARNNGNTALADQIANERGILDEAYEDITDARREYKNFIDNLNLGNLGDIVDSNCEGILGEDLLEYIDKMFTWVKISVPIILIVLGSLDFGKAVLVDDKDELRKATSKFIKRCIIAVAIFFIPSLLSYLLHFFNAITSTGGVSTCGIG